MDARMKVTATAQTSGDMNENWMAVCQSSFQPAEDVAPTFMLSLSAAGDF